MVEIGVWVGWSDILEQGADRVLGVLWNYGVSRVSVFVVAGGKVYFEPRLEYGKVKPIRGSERDLLAECVKVASKIGMKLTATVVCVVDPEHIKQLPEESLVDYYGNRHDCAFCPNSQLLREYLSKIAADIALNYDIDEVELDYIRFKRHREDDYLPQHLFAGKYCYCERCRKLAQEQGIEWSRLSKVLGKIFRESKATVENLSLLASYSSMGDLVKLYAENPELAEWLNFRYRSVARLVGKIKESLKDTGTGVKLSADLFYPTLSWQVGQNYAMLGEYLETVKPMVYTPRMGAWETRYFRKLIKKLGKGEEELVKFLSRLVGVELPAKIDELEYKGFPDQVAERETIKVKRELPSKVKVYTGLYSSWDPSAADNPPERVKRQASYALRGGADGLYFFAYRGTPEENLKALREIAEST